MKKGVKSLWWYFAGVPFESSLQKEFFLMITGIGPLWLFFETTAEFNTNTHNRCSWGLVKGKTLTLFPPAKIGHFYFIRHTLQYLIEVHVRLFFSTKKSTLYALIRYLYVIFYVMPKKSYVITATLIF